MKRKPLTFPRFAATFVFMATLCAGYTVFVVTGCSTLKGAASETHHYTATTQNAATTQETSHTQVNRVAATQASGGAAYTAESTATIDVTKDAVKVVVHDAKTATTQPTTITVDRDNSLSYASANLTSASQTTSLGDLVSKTGPSYTGLADNMSVDGDKLNASVTQGIWSILKQRWPVILGLLGSGLVLIFAPPPIQHLPTGIALVAAAVAALLLSDIWFYSLIGVAILIPLWPHIRNSAVFGRIVAQLDDWKSDMGTVEKTAFNASLTAAAGSSSKLVDQVRVQKKHGSGPPVVAPPVPAEASAKAA